MNGLLTLLIVVHMQARSAPSSPRLMTTGLYPASPELPSLAQVESAVGNSHQPDAVSTDHSALFGRDGPDRSSNPSAVSSLTASLAALAGIRTREESAERSRSNLPSARAGAQAGLRRHSFESSMAAQQKHGRSRVPAQPGTVGAASSEGSSQLTDSTQPVANGQSHAASDLQSRRASRQQDQKTEKSPAIEEHLQHCSTGGKDAACAVQTGPQPSFDVDQLPLQDDPDDPRTRR